jgi:N-alpha-acetyl-L-2,4-diaminobutyrate deacetylase
LRDTPIVPTIDLDADGVAHGHLRLPWSRDESAWGNLMIPVTVVKNGAGPTALLTGGNHGDEYEGPIALFNLARELKADDVAGRVIIVPAMNFPAFRAATRTSPVDGQNLNRVFPGRPDGTVTEKIADYFERTLLAMADRVLDIHSGGRTLDFLPFAAAHRRDDGMLERAALVAVRAFSAPWSMMLTEIDAVGMYDTSAEAQGKVFVSTELGGGGSTTAASVAIAARGVRNFLMDGGILAGEPDLGPTAFLDTPSPDCFVFSGEEGLYEPLADLGADIVEGRILARIHPTGHTGRAPQELKARRGGLLVGRHFPGLIGIGDCAAMIAERTTLEELL